MRITAAASEKLHQLLREHPEDQIVRISLRDLDENRLVFTIALDDAVDPADRVETMAGLTIAVAPSAAARMEDVVLDYEPPDGFRFHHSAQTPPLNGPPAL